MRRSLRTFLRTWTRRSFRTSPGSLRRSYSKLSFQLWRPTLRHPWEMSLSTSMHCYQNCCTSFTPLLDTECTADHALDMLCFQLSYIRSYIVIRPPLLLLVEILTKRRSSAPDRHSTDCLMHFMPAPHQAPSRRLPWPWLGFVHFLSCLGTPERSGHKPGTTLHEMKTRT
jgi:hypothetical protein